MVTPSVRFDFRFCPPLFGDPRECRVTSHFRPLLGPNLPVLFTKPDNL